MGKAFLSRTIVLVILISAGQPLCGQSNPITFSNYTNAYFNEKREDVLPGLRFFGPQINEITLTSDTTFEFWSRPNVSCFTWKSYKGTWKKYKDTLFFSDSYQVKEIDTKATYKRDSKPEFIITFKTDKGSFLKSRSIKIQYEYDYNAHIDSPEKTFVLNANNSVVIPYTDIPRMDILAALRIEYFLNGTEKRYTYLTENNVINVRKLEVPNIIDVEFVERPGEEMVYRTIKAVVKTDTLKIVSSSKTKTVLPDYSREILFEDSYTLKK